MRDPVIQADEALAVFFIYVLDKFVIRDYNKFMLDIGTTSEENDFLNR